MIRLWIIALCLVLTGCPLVIKDKAKTNYNATVELVVLGNVQDAGSPHIGCIKSCCEHLHESPDQSRKVVSLGVVDHLSKTKYLFDATPDMTAQLEHLNTIDTGLAFMPNGIFLTHAHVGHYTGLMYLGKEAINANCVPVYTMPRMNDFLKRNGPWNQLVLLDNIELLPLQNRTRVELTDSLTVTPFLVPHRDEYSETVGYIIEGPSKSALFIPDIDKWSKWETSIIEAIKGVDYAFIDATFYDGEEIKSRDISQIPHPFVIESMETLNSLSDEEKAKVHFIHMNHTNPLLEPTSRVYFVISVFSIRFCTNQDCPRSWF